MLLWQRPKKGPGTRVVVCHAQGAHGAEGPDLPSQIKGALALALESSSPLDLRVQLIVFSAVLRAHQPYCIGRGHNEGPLRIRPRFGAHYSP